MYYQVLVSKTNTYMCRKHKLRPATCSFVQSVQNQDLIIEQTVDIASAS